MIKLKWIFKTSHQYILQTIIFIICLVFLNLNSYAAAPICSSIFVNVNNTIGKESIIKELIQLKYAIDTTNFEKDSQSKLILIEKYLKVLKDGMNKYGPEFEQDLFKSLMNNSKNTESQNQTLPKSKKVREFFPTQTQIDNVTANSSYFNESNQRLSVILDNNRLITYQFPQMKKISEIPLPSRLNNLIGHPNHSYLIASSYYGDIYKIDLISMKVEPIPEMKMQSGQIPKYQFSPNGNWLVNYLDTVTTNSLLNSKHNYIIKLYHLRDQTFFQRNNDTTIKQFDFLDKEHFFYFYDVNAELKIIDLTTPGHLYTNGSFITRSITPIFDNLILTSDVNGKLSFIDLIDLKEKSINLVESVEGKNLNGIYFSNISTSQLNQNQYLISGKNGSQIDYFLLKKENNQNIRQSQTLILEKFEFDRDVINIKYDSDLPGYVCITDQWIYLISSKESKIQRVAKKSMMTHFKILENGKFILDYSNKWINKDGKVVYLPESTETPIKIYHVEQGTIQTLPQKLTSYDHVKTAPQSGFIFTEQIQIRELKLPLVTLEVIQLYQEFDAKK